MLYLKAAFFAVLVPGTVAGLVPYYITLRGGQNTPDWYDSWARLGWVPTAAGVVMLVWCIADFAASGKGTPAPIDPPKHLVVRGLYRYVRNPMYIGVLLILLGEWLVFPSAALMIYAAAIFSMFHTFVLLYEEPVLRRKFGESYDAYCRDVNRWVPRRSGTKDGFPRSRE